ncbi:hypothetical protein C8R45DRAFT_273431 [Mycena sanguinolenta]|nr:hypothetical protein C8R45DRAFT_273431 [Mycena sanguinolenta]
MALYYTWNRGSDNHLNRHMDFQSSRRHSLYTAGESILQIYHRLIDRLSADRLEPDKRLQNAFAAAVWDVPEADFMAMSDSELAALRARGTTQMLVPEMAPSLVIYLGGPRQQAIHSSPSTSGQLTFASAEEIAAHDDDHPPDEDIDGSPWDGEWDKPEGPWPCPWGWHTRAVSAKSSLIYLSGAYVVWPNLWKGTETILEGGRLYQHMSVTLFHELVHYARTVVWISFLNSELCGVLENTPPKTIDHDSKVVRNTGEAGRFAEMLAFGGVVDLLKTPENKIQLFTTDPNRKVGEGDFKLDDTLVESLFRDPKPPIEFESLASRRQQISVPEYARTKGGGCWEETAEIIGEQPKTDSWIPTQANPSGLIPMTGELKQYLDAHRSELTKWRCVE